MLNRVLFTDPLTEVAWAIGITSWTGVSVLRYHPKPPLENRWDILLGGPNVLVHWPRQMCTEFQSRRVLLSALRTYLPSLYGRFKIHRSRLVSSLVTKVWKEAQPFHITRGGVTNWMGRLAAYPATEAKVQWSRSL